MVALPFCSIHLTARKPRKPLTVLNTLGDHIKKRRLELGLLQRQVAGLLGVDEMHSYQLGEARDRAATAPDPKDCGVLVLQPDYP